MLIFEAVPAAGAGAAILALTLVVAFIVALGIVNLAIIITRSVGGAVGGFLGHIPGVGGVIEGAIEHVVNKFVHYLGQAAHGLDGLIGWSLSTIAVTFRFLGHEIRGLAGDTYHMFTWLLHHWLPYIVGAKLYHLIAGINKTTAVQRQQGAAISHGGAVTAQAGRSAEWARWRAAELAGAVAIPRALPGIRAREGTLQEEQTTLAKRLDKVAALLAALVGGGLLIKALEHADLGHLRCRNNRRLGKALCGLPSGLLEALLGGAIEAMVVLDLCVIARIVTRLVKAFEPELRLLVVVENAALCGGQHKAPPGLTIASQPWPVPSASIAL